jgi:beta-alanine degradation protein BauB
MQDTHNFHLLGSWPTLLLDNHQKDPVKTKDKRESIMKASVHLMMSVLSAILLLITKAATAQDPLQAASQNYKVLFENDRVRILEYRSTPGEKTEMHSHPDYLVYDLGNGYKIKFTFPDGKAKIIEGKTGTVSWQEAVTHAAENVGTIDAHALLIELKK